MLSIPPWVYVDDMKLLSALVIASSIFAVSACRADEPAMSAVPATTALTPGEAVYRQSCARCHGVFLEGRPGKGAPPIDSVKLATLNDQSLRLTIVNGKGDMPAFDGLSTLQIDLVINFLRSQA